MKHHIIASLIIISCTIPALSYAETPQVPKSLCIDNALRARNITTTTAKSEWRNALHVYKNAQKTAYATRKSGLAEARKLQNNSATQAASAEVREIYRKTVTANMNARNSAHTKYVESLQDASATYRNAKRACLE